MDKDESFFSSWKGSGNSSSESSQSGNSFSESSQNGQESSTISQKTKTHSNLGDYTTTNRHKSGGHGQDSLDYMDKQGIKYEINIEYNNGVRAGNILDSKQSFSRSGNNHTWFPKNWTDSDISDAGAKVADSFKGDKKSGVTYSKIINGVNVTVMFDSSGNVASIYPSHDQPGGIKE